MHTVNGHQGGKWCGLCGAFACPNCQLGTLCAEITTAHETLGNLPVIAVRVNCPRCDFTWGALAGAEVAIG